MSSALERYRREVSIHKKGYEQERHRINVIARSFLGRKKPANVTTVDIATYRDQRLKELNPKTGKRLSPATVIKELVLLSSFFRIAEVEWGYCKDNPAAKVKKPQQPPGRDRRPSPRETKQILQYAFDFSNSGLYSIIVLALETCMRQGEILALDWRYVNLRNRTLHIPKTKNGHKRDIPLSLRAREALIRLGVKDDGKVFAYTSSGLKRTWRYMMRHLAIKNLTFHDLRHEAISRLVELGTLSLIEIAEISGHKSLNMLLRYTHLSARRLVRKLEGNKHRGKQVILEHLLPYPALVEVRRNEFFVRLLDFDDVEARAIAQEDAVQMAGYKLLAKLMASIRDSQPIPPPDQYLEQVDRNRIIMVNPLAASSS